MVVKIGRVRVDLPEAHVCMGKPMRRGKSTGSQNG